MLDEDLACPDCVGEAVQRRFLYYPNHMVTRVEKLQEGTTQQCSICRKSVAKYSVSIQMNSLNAAKAMKEREMLLQAEKKRVNGSGKP